MQTEPFATLAITRTNLVEFLRERKLGSAAAWLLDALAPMHLVLAQFIHAGSPLLRPSLSANQVETLARILENPSEYQAFTSQLREEIADGN